MSDEDLKAELARLKEQTSAWALSPNAKKPRRRGTARKAGRLVVGTKLGGADLKEGWPGL